ncbi:hypothetical protein ACW7N6_18545 [Streptomyces sp. UC1A3]
MPRTISKTTSGTRTRPPVACTSSGASTAAAMIRTRVPGWVIGVLAAGGVHGPLVARGRCHSHRPARSGPPRVRRPG